jgi:hypothetical protein
LRDLDLAELPHPLLPLFLLFEQFAFAGHVAAIAFGQHVLAQGLDVSRAMILPPIAAWIATAKSWRGIKSFNLSHSARPRRSAWLRWTMIDNASTGSPFTRMFISTRSPSL